MNELLGIRLRSSLKNLESLPAMPDIAARLLALPLETEAGEAQMLKLVERDPQIFARLIGLANSSAMGTNRKVNGIQDAAMLLGMKRLKSVVIGIATMSKMLSQPAGKSFDPHDLWTHSMTVAIVMNLIAQAMPPRIRPDDNQIFLAGLLHDIGLMALHYLDPEASDELHRQLRLHPRSSISEIEMGLLGMTHGHIGGQLVRHWKLHEEIIEVVEMHHSQYLSDVSLDNPLVRLIIIAEKLLPDFGLAEHTYEPIEDSEWRELCIDPARAVDIADMANELGMQVVQLPDAPTNSVRQSAEEAAPNRNEAAPNAVQAPAATPPVTEPLAAENNAGNSALANIFKPVKWLFRMIGRLFK